MARFFFDYRLADAEGETVQEDREGLEFEDAGAATREALVALGELARDILPRRSHRELGILVRDADKNILMRMRVLIEVSQ